MCDKTESDFCGICAKDNIPQENDVKDSSKDLCPDRESFLTAVAQLTKLNYSKTSRFCQLCQRQVIFCLTLIGKSKHVFKELKSGKSSKDILMEMPQIFSSLEEFNPDLILDRSSTLQVIKPFKNEPDSLALDCSMSLPDERDMIDKFGKSKLIQTRKILPRTSQGAKQLIISSKQASNDNVMIPVTLTVPCTKCGEAVIASKYQDLKKHKCAQNHKAKSGKSASLTCVSDKCGLKFSSMNALTHHVRHCHVKSKSPSIRDMKSVSEETVKIEDSNRTFKCKVSGCSKSYRHERYLREHMRTHVGEKPFKCGNCYRRFYRIVDLKKHRLVKVCL